MNCETRVSMWNLVMPLKRTRRMDVSSRAGMIFSFNELKLYCLRLEIFLPGKSNQYILSPYPIFTCKKSIIPRSGPAKNGI